MDLRQFEVFCRVYKERSFSRAAHELGLSQPTVSAHIKDLEESIGSPVFNRLGREIQPTEAGEYLYGHAKSLLSLKRDLVEKMAGFLNRVEGTLTVGASSVPGEYLLPALVTRFHADYPKVRARLRISDSAETIDDLRRGDIELGVVGARLPDDDLVFEPFASDSLVLAVPATGAWTRRKEVTLRQLRELPLLIRESGSATRTVLETALARRGLTLADLNVAAELGAMGAIKEAVKQGHGVSFVSALSIASDCKAATLHAVRIRELGAIRRAYYTVVSQRRVLSPISRTFLDYARAAVGTARQPVRRGRSKPRDQPRRRR